MEENELSGHSIRWATPMTSNEALLVLRWRFRIPAIMRFLALSRLPRQFIRGISCSKPFSPFSNLTWCACECDALRKPPDDSVWSRLRCTIFRSFLYWLIDLSLFTASPECIEYVTRSVLILMDNSVCTQWIFTEFYSIILCFSLSFSRRITPYLILNIILYTATSSRSNISR